jgi:predicted permease
VALSIVLLTGSGLFIKSLRALESVDIGFPKEGLLTLEAAPERQIFGTSQWLALQSEILDRVRSLPGVRSATWATMNPLSGRDRGAMIEAQGFLPTSEKDKEIHIAAVSPEYFDTLGIPLQLGRAFTPGDTAATAKVAILNETAARFYFGNQNPLGRKVRFTNYPSNELVYEVVGLVKDSKHDELRDPAQRFVYLPIPQSVDRINRLALALRVSGPPIAYIEAVRREISNARTTILVTNVSTMEKQIDRLLIRERLLAALSTSFGIVAVLLACIGLYGILAYAVTRRTNEIGVRLALGADRRSVIWLILREALLLAACGIALGLPIAFSVGKVAKAMLYGADAFDPLVLSTSVLILFALSTLAATIPSRRASRLDPITALRND